MGGGGGAVLEEASNNLPHRFHSILIILHVSMNHVGEKTPISDPIVMMMFIEPPMLE